MTYWEERYEIQQRQTETLQKVFEVCCKAMEVESDRQEAIGTLQFFDRQQAINTLLKLRYKYYCTNQIFMDHLLLCGLSDEQLQNKLKNIIQDIYLLALMKYCAEEAVKSMAKQALETSRQNNWNF
ncbi:MAG: hypothetical protein IKD10_12090 [Lentisphaeria bacterium]|nr:hypothetical protein [Lentisphaeria bacterium]